MITFDYISVGVNPRYTEHNTSAFVKYIRTFMTNVIIV